MCQKYLNFSSHIGKQLKLFACALLLCTQASVHMLYSQSLPQSQEQSQILNQLEQNLISLQKTSESRSQTIVQLQTESKTLKEQLASSNLQIASLLQINSDLQSQQQAQQTAYEQKINSLQSNLDQLTKQLSSSQEISQNLDPQIASLMQTISDLKSNSQKQQDNYNSILVELQAQVTKLTADSTTYQADLTKITEQYQKVSNSYNSLETDIKELQKENKQLKVKSLCIGYGSAVALIAVGAYTLSNYFMNTSNNGQLFSGLVAIGCGALVGGFTIKINLK